MNESNLMNNELLELNGSRYYIGRFHDFDKTQSKADMDIEIGANPTLTLYPVRKNSIFFDIEVYF